MESLFVRLCTDSICSIVVDSGFSNDAGKVYLEPLDYISSYHASYSISDYFDTTLSGIEIVANETTKVCMVMHAEPQEIPTLSEWGIIILALLLLATGTIAVIRKHRAVTVSK